MNEPNKIRIRAALRCHMRGIDEGIARSASFISRAAGDFWVPERPILMIFTAFLGSGKRAPRHKAQALVLNIKLYDQYTSTRAAFCTGKGESPPK